MKKTIGIILAACVMATAFSPVGEGLVWAKESEREIPQNPKHFCSEDPSMDDTEWSYIYFGSYPQSEVSGSALTEDIVSAAYDENGDAVLASGKYRRIGRRDAWDLSYFGSNEYHYFKWEPIKWRVLENDGQTMFVLSDIGIENKFGGLQGETWENSSRRNWLNEEFYNLAFTRDEQMAMEARTVTTEDNEGMDGGGDTTDYIYYLSIQEVLNPQYGFCSNANLTSKSRGLKVSDYMHIKGAYTYENCGAWWLRSPGTFAGVTAGVLPNGLIYGISSDAYVRLGNNSMGAPALHVQCDSKQWTYAGGGVGEGEGTSPKTAQSITATDITQTYGAKTFSLGAKSSGNGALSYIVSDTRVATVDAGGNVTIKGCGIASIIITAAETDTYNKAQKTITLTVRPQKAKIVSVKSKKKKTAVVKWKKDSAVSGYLIECATDKKFKKNKVKVTVSKNKTVSKTVKKLKAGKKYYIRICAYTQSGNVKVQGDWSKVKTVTVKK